MTPERWQQVDRVLQSVLERPHEERAAFLDRACAGDEELKREVRSLLASYDEAGSFIEHPALEEESSALAGEHRPSIVGQVVGNYRITEPLGTGGMGEVYLALDTRNNRRAALKLLPSYFTKDEQRVRRFAQEARAVLTLNHPNIVTIYEIGHEASAHFIASELIEGETLRATLRRGALSIQEALDVAVQVASALGYAHEHGVVHRDIKPENIMLRPDGYVKVLDFGIAKLTERRPAASQASTEAPTRMKVETSPGMVMGTVHYMSPEQARGLQTDERTDIWSLGVLLYEMVAGTRPFEGETMSDVVSLILQREPQPLAQHLEGVPAELERIIMKALAKSKEERYRTAKDFLADLKRFKRQHEQQSEIDSSLPPGGVEANATTLLNEAAGTSGTGAKETASGHGKITDIYKKHRRGVVLAMAALLLGAAAVLGSWYFARRWTSNVSEPFSRIRMTRLTTTGKANFPGISPDGKYLVYVTGERAQESIRLMHIPTGSDREIVSPAGVVLCCSFFSADGNYIYYAKMGTNVPSIVYQMPVLGGTTRVIGEDLDTPPTFSPDGKRMAFLRGYPTEGLTALMIANADGTGEQRLMTYITTWVTYTGGLAWSPDGEVILMGMRGVDASGLYRQMVTVRVKDGMVTQINPQRWTSLAHFAWLRDGSGFIFTGSDQPSEFPMQIWYASYPGGVARRVTNDVNDYRWVRMTSDSQSFVTTAIERSSNLWIAPNADAARAAPITSNKRDGLDGVAFAPDGRVVYTSAAAGGNPHIWIANADGTGQKQLTADLSSNIMPTVSPDGRYILFVSNRAGAQNIWRMEMDGHNPTRLTDGMRDQHPYCSPDGRWVFYTSTNSGKQRVTRVPIEGGNSVPLTDYITGNPVVSPDGKQIACGYFDEKALRYKVVIIPVEGGPPVKTFDINVWPMKLRWTPDGRALTYIQNRAGVSNIWSQPVDGGKPAQLTDFKTEQINFFDWSRDGRQLLLARGSISSDIVLISESR